MKNYKVYFEFYGRKMQTNVLAENEEKAKEMIKNKIVFHEVKKANDYFNKSVDMLDDMINILGGKKPKS